MFVLGIKMATLKDKRKYKDTFGTNLSS